MSGRKPIELILSCQDGDEKENGPINSEIDATVQLKSQLIDNKRKNQSDSVANPNSTECNRATAATRSSPSGYAVKKPSPKRSPTSWREILSNPATRSKPEEEEAEKRKQEALAQCKDLAQEPSILDRFYQLLPRCGLVGEERTAKLIYLILTSRLLKRPLAVVVKGQSSTGKSFLVEKILEFFPEGAYLDLESMSARYLAYSEESFVHRILVLNEVRGLGSEIANYYMRGILSKGRIRHGTVDSTKDGLKGKLLEKDGPTGLIVTTTDIELHPENETRMLSIPADDSPEQTRKVFKALASESDDSIDMATWHALQTWLESEEQRVSIPYAGQLADYIPPIEVRLRRDFGVVLNLIRVHALLHRATRESDAQGCIIATLEDYAIVRELVADLIGEEVDISVSPVIRETVEAVKNIIKTNKAQPVMAKHVQKRLEADKGKQLHKSSISRRIDRAISKGYLKNIAAPGSGSLSLILGDPMPANGEILPPVVVLKSCKVAFQSDPPENIVQQRKTEENQKVNKDSCTVVCESDGLGVSPGDPVQKVKRGETATVFGPEGKKVYPVNQLKEAIEKLLNYPRRGEVGADGE